MCKIFSKNSPTGFTLIEIVVALGILVIVLQLVVGAYARFVDFQRGGIHEQEMQEDIRLVLQLFNREARTAYGSTYEPLPVTDPQGVVFRNQEGICVKYERDNNDKSLYRSESKIGTDPHANCANHTLYDPPRRLTDKTTTIITSLQFTAKPARVDPNDPNKLLEQGYMTIHMKVATPSKTEPLELQSTVTSRQFIPYNPP